MVAKNCAECVNYQQDVLIAWSWDGVVVPGRAELVMRGLGSCRGTKGEEGDLV